MVNIYVKHTHTRTQVSLQNSVGSFCLPMSAVFDTVTACENDRYAAFNRVQYQFRARNCTAFYLLLLCV